MKIKVCGMRDSENLKEVLSLNPDFIGLIFYPASSRYVGDKATSILSVSLNPVKKVGVFVNESEEKVIQTVVRFKLDLVQLHGDESPEYCKNLKEKGILVIKTISVSGTSDFYRTKEYAGVCDYFLFDTKTPDYGGSGKKFNWSILAEYKQNIPFLLSGGISGDDVAAILEIKHPFMAGVDLNSCFESAPAYKDVEKLKNFINTIKKRE